MHSKEIPGGIFGGSVPGDNIKENAKTVHDKKCILRNDTFLHECPFHVEYKIFREKYFIEVFFWNNS